jgi:hypothetical protein
MDSGLNKVISFILGLVVVVVFVAVLTGKINLKKPGFLSGKISPTVAPSPLPTSTTTSVSVQNGQNVQVNKYDVKSPGSIPSTGLPTIVLPILLSALAGGIFLRKKE